MAVIQLMHVIRLALEWDAIKIMNISRHSVTGNVHHRRYVCHILACLVSLFHYHPPSFLSSLLHPILPGVGLCICVICLFFFTRSFQTFHQMIILYSIFKSSIILHSYDLLHAQSKIDAQYAYALRDQLYLFYYICIWEWLPNVQILRRLLLFLAGVFCSIRHTIYEDTYICALRLSYVIISECFDKILWLNFKYGRSSLIRNSWSFFWWKFASHDCHDCDCPDVSFGYKNNTIKTRGRKRGEKFS